MAIEGSEGGDRQDIGDRRLKDREIGEKGLPSGDGAGEYGGGNADGFVLEGAGLIGHGLIQM